MTAMRKTWGEFTNSFVSCFTLHFDSSVSRFDYGPYTTTAGVLLLERVLAGGHDFPADAGSDYGFFIKTGNLVSFLRL